MGGAGSYAGLHQIVATSLVPVITLFWMLVVAIQPVAEMPGPVKPVLSTMVLLRICGLPPPNGTVAAIPPPSLAAVLPAMRLFRKTGDIVLTTLIPPPSRGVAGDLVALDDAAAPAVDVDATARAAGIVARDDVVGDRGRAASEERHAAAERPAAARDGEPAKGRRDRLLGVDADRGIAADAVDRGDVRSEALDGDRLRDEQVLVVGPRGRPVTVSPSTAATIAAWIVG